MLMYSDVILLQYLVAAKMFPPKFINLDDESFLREIKVDVCLFNSSIISHILNTHPHHELRLI